MIYEWYEKCICIIIYIYGIYKLQIIMAIEFWNIKWLQNKKKWWISLFYFEISSKFIYKKNIKFNKYNIFYINKVIWCKLFNIVNK